MPKQFSPSSGTVAAAFCAIPFLSFPLVAAERPDSAALMKESGVKKGIVVQLGCESGKHIVDLRTGARFVVQALDRDEAKVAAARKHIRSQGVYGPVSARQWHGDSLPFADDLINFIVADDLLGIPEREIVRVLTPLGTAWIRNGDAWRKIKKPWPREIDEWTHFLHSATGNAVSKDTRVGPPRRLQWSGGPLWGRSHEFNNSLPALVTARGRLFYVFDQGPTGMEDGRLPEKWTLFARDAFNGALLWERPLSNWSSRVWKTRALRFFRGGMARRLVVDGDRLFCTFSYGGPVQMLDTATGRTLATIPKTEGAEEILVADNQVICSSQIQADRGRLVTKITCYDIASEQVKWQVQAVRLLSQVLSVGRNEVVYHDRTNIVCLNRRDGSVRWKTPDKLTTGKRGRSGKMLILADGKVVVSSRNRILALSVADGKIAWQAPGARGRSMREHDLFYAKGRVWVASSGAKIAGYDIRTGKRTKELDASAVQSHGHHLRCYRAKATENFLITQFRGVEFLSLGQEAHTQNDWLRGSCTYGIMPANGFLYTPPHSCFCFSAALVKGFKAFTSETKQEWERLVERAAPGPVEKGPHYGWLAPDAPPAKSSWPAYRHDARRTGATTNAIPATLRRTWKVALDTELTPPVAADGRIFVAAKNRHTIHALEAASGRPLWTFAAGARIDSPPSIHRGVLVFGGADGYLYCVRADDGRLAWRRRLAPAERWIAANGQLESVWRLHGSVAIHNGLAYVSAGRSSYLDGGLFLYAVDIQSGEIRHQARLDTVADTRIDKAGKSFVAAYHIEGAHSDLLVAQGGYIYLNQQRFTPDLKLKSPRYLGREEITRRPSLNLDNKDYVNKDIFKVRWRNTTFNTYDKLAGILVDENKNVGERDMGLHLFTTSGFLDATFFSRTFWMYSKTWTGFNMSILAPKSGQLLVVGDKNTYAVKAYTSRFPLSPKFNPATKGYLLIADRNDNEPTMDKRAWGKDKGMGFSRGAPPVWHQWLPVQVRAMVLAGDQLALCGPPDVLKEGDPAASLEGRMGSELRIVSATDGKTISQQKLTETPLFDGMIVAGGRLYLCTEQGDIVCMGPGKN